MTLEEWEAGPSNVHLADGQVLSILAAIADGWLAAVENEELTAALREREMTGWLIAGMRKNMENRGTTVARGTETPRGDLPDICIYFRRLREEQNEHEPHAGVECKRVAGNDTTLCGRYVRFGIDRFSGGKYGARRKCGFMVGYVVDGSASSCVDGINRYLARHRSAEERLGTDRLAARFPVWLSCHARKAASPIEVRHQFLVFRDKGDHCAPARSSSP